MLDARYPFDRSINHIALMWLLLTQLVVMLPFAFNLPLWLIPVLLLSGWWRMRVLSGKAGTPGPWLKVLIMVLGVGGLGFSGLSLPTLDAMVALLLLGFAFKTLEMVQHRDAMVVIFLGFLLVAVNFLYSQSMLAALYGALSLMVLTTALISIQHQMEPLSGLALLSVRQQLAAHCRLAGLLLLQCLPLMVLIFLFTPRLPPLWQLPLMTPRHTTGISDQMTPGDIASLSQNPELAFRVRFMGRKPQQSALYWRGLTLGHFDGKTWSQFDTPLELAELRQRVRYDFGWNGSNVALAGESLDYEAIYESSGQPWLFTLATVAQIDGEVLRTADYRIMARQPLNAPLLLRATSFPEARRDLQLN
ncbi:MAG TPA: DUF3488 domain-containing protein, partial [Thiolinea sp.]|nr:DUF3488 domain-containing protein [Thiolinea sp.]